MNPDFSEMLSTLSEEGVEFLLVGAYALAVHGVPRATGDLDVWIRPTSGNAQRVLQALGRFGAPLHSLTAADLTTPGTVFQIGVVPNRVDLLTAIDGVSFEEAWSRRVVPRVSGLSIPVIGRADLIANKRATGRTVDLADAERLEALG